MVTIRNLVWDEWNVAHIARHGVTADEVESVCHGPFILREAYSGRLMVVGPSSADRIVVVVLAPLEQETFHPVTAYPASPRLRRIYEQEKGSSS